MASTPDRIDASELDIDEGDAVCLQDTRHGRRYLTVVNGIVLKITDERVSAMAPEAAHYERAHAGQTRSTSAGEAFEFLHGSYEPTVTQFCLGCGKEFTGKGGRCRSCPVGYETKSIEYPDVPEREPRGV